MANACGHCGMDVSGEAQRCQHRYDHIDPPPIQAIAARVAHYSVAAVGDVVVAIVRRRASGDVGCVHGGLHHSPADQSAAPFSALFTLWLPITTVVGLTSLPSHCHRSR
ncbi:hypothetical protein GOB85_07015 [Acetobacter sp. LMG 1636]|uniref:C2H2-type domain-containing protein n=1 Tax=Acetobacter fallax TaxID=1737473 RepID=A0ABX0KAU5_9PROT|nr:hypothetical protein [Acetobacter fallax]NHO35873.1 hypothetical protein [Acetobacter fallax]